MNQHAALGYGKQDQIVPEYDSMSPDSFSSFNTSPPMYSQVI